MRIAVATLVVGFLWPVTGATILSFNNTKRNELFPPAVPTKPVSCSCGVFLSGQFVKGSHEPPKGNPAILHEYDESFSCNAIGQKQCMNKCLEVLARHLPNSPALICGSIDRDCYKEKAHLFVKNCDNNWINSNLSAGREYCCKESVPYKCPILK